MEQSDKQTMPFLSRRTFVAGAAATGALIAGAGLAGCDQADGEKASKGNESIGSGEINTANAFADCEPVYGCCSPECQHHLLKGYVKDGTLMKVESAEVNESPACARGLARVELNNSDLRLTKPLKLVGEKGSGDFEEITWDEAFDLLEEKIQYALDNGGSKTIVYDRGSGNFSSLARDLPAAFMSWLGGTQNCSGNTCCAGIDAAVSTILGKRTQPTRNEIPHSSYIIAWGNNPVISMTGYFGRFQEMMEKGGTLVTIDPFYSETADKSQEWIQPWPGSDSALALAMLKIIIDEELHDRDYLIAHTTAPCLIDTATDAPYFSDPEDDTTYMVYDGASKEIVAHDKEGIEPVLSVADTDIASPYVTIYDLIKAEANKWDKDAVEAETGCSYEDITRIAREYATTEHAMIIQNMGAFQRTENGAYATATQVYLALFTGNIGHEGDGVYDVGGASTINEVNPAFESNPDAELGTGIPRVHFGEFILDDEPNPINLAWFFCANFAAQMPNTNMVKEGLKKIPFVVTSDQFMTATCLYSDLVLPVTSVFETENVTANSRSTTVSIGEALVTPPGEAKSDLQIAAEMAERFGFGDKFNKEPKEYIAHVIEPLGITYEELAEKKGIDATPEGYIAYKDAQFFTSTGKAHLWVQQWVDEGYPGIACHQRPVESPLNTDGLAAKYPLASVQRKTRHQVHTTFNNLETMLKLDGHEPTITINPVDAEARSIADGDKVIAYNDRGEHAGVAFVTGHIKQGIVVLENGWSDTTASSSSNVTNNTWPTLGTMHCCNSTLIEVKKGA